MSRSVSESSAASGDDSNRREDRQSRKQWTDEDRANFWKRKRTDKRARKRERSSAKREEQQAAWEKLTDVEKQALKDKALLVHEERRKEKEAFDAKCHQNLLDPKTPSIVFDMAFWSTMNQPDKKSTIAQIKFSHSSLKKAGFPLKPVFTSYDTSDPLLQALKEYEGFKSFPPLFHAQSLQEIYSSDKTVVVYLSADSKNVLTTIDEGTSYVVGAFVDHNSQKGATENAAKEMGFKTSRLPIVETLTDVGNLCKVLTINHVTDCLTTFQATSSWEAAFSTLPTRRRENAV